ncbi:MAG: SDR family oxidoreductase [Gammaproteobacteria bacterium]
MAMQAVEGRTVMITGGANGLGFGMAEAFLAAGARVAIADRDAQGLARARADLASAGEALFTQVLDVADYDAWQSAFESVQSALGPIDILCNNAGVACGTTALDMVRIEDWRWGFSINVDGVFFGCKTFVQHARASRRGGHIVNTASLAAVFPAVNAGCYSPTKFAVLGISQQLLRELAPIGIGVSVLCPGAIATGITDRSRGHQPSLRADPAAEAAREEIGQYLSAFGARPRKLGEYVIKCILRGDFYIITHPEWRPLVQQQVDMLLGALREPADPERPEDVAALLQAVSG